MDILGTQGHVEVLKEAYNEDTGRKSVETFRFPVRKNTCRIIGRKLNYIPVQSIAKFATLTTLDLSFNKIEKIPESLVEAIPLLEHFFIGHNNVEKLPSNIGRWKKLKTLYAQFNKLKNIPDMSSLRKLERLNLRGNHLHWVWYEAFGEEWDPEAIKKAAGFARKFYKLTGLKESEINQFTSIGDFNWGGMESEDELELDDADESEILSTFEATGKIEADVAKVEAELKAMVEAELGEKVEAELEAKAEAEWLKGMVEAELEQKVELGIEALKITEAGDGDGDTTTKLLLQVYGPDAK